MPPSFTITVAPDGLKAYLQVPLSGQAAYPQLEEVQAALAQKRIVFGIREEVLRQAVAQRQCNCRILVAEGTPADPGRAGRLELLIDMANRGKPRLLRDGSVDLRDLQSIVFVHEGDPLVRRVPAVAPRAGMSIFGTPLAPPGVTEAVLKVGPGTRISEQDPHLLVAACDGDVVVAADGSVAVVKAKIIPGDVDYSVGNIEFEGDVKVMGGVRSGFSISSQGRVFVQGRVEDASISAGGDVALPAGMAGASSASISSGGSVTAHHLEHVAVSAVKDVLVAEDVMYGEVKAGGCVRVRSIVGGRVCAREGIVAESAGNAAEIRTVLDLGGEELLTQQRALAVARRERTGAEIGSLNARMYELVRKKMNSEGRLPDADKDHLRRLKGHKEMLLKQGAEHTRRINLLDETLHRTVVPVLKVARIFPNTVIRYGAVEKTIRGQLRDAVISVRGTTIIDSQTGKELS